VSRGASCRPSRATPAEAGGQSPPTSDDATGAAALGDERKAGAVPRGDPAVEVLGLESARAQALRGAVAPGPAAAHRHDHVLLRYFGETVSELAQGDVLRPLDVTRVPLILLADVEEMQVGTPLADVLWQHDPILAHGGGMDPKATLERLERERADLVATVDRIKERLAVPQLESGGDIALADQHPADVASETEARELDVARQTMFEARIQLIDEALRRLERGEYGRCIVCGREIPAERLELLPETPHCVEDAEREQQSSAR
jgi:RNA polymerase-binding transcription factor DksA